jgi:hypothetical protein
MSMLRPPDVQPMHQHGCGPQSVHPSREYLPNKEHHHSLLAACLTAAQPPHLFYDAPPPPAAGNDEINLMKVERNNPSGDAKEYDNNPVVYFDALTVLPDLNDFVEDNNNDEALSPALGLLANGSNAVGLTTGGRSTNGVEAPPALAAPLAPPADLSNSLGDNNALGAGPSIINGTPVGNNATGVNGALGSPVNGSAATTGTCPHSFYSSWERCPPSIDHCSWPSG